MQAVHGDAATGGARTYVLLSTEELLEWDEWKEPARALLHAQKSLDLGALIAG